ncbi:hypothetical protein E2320_002751, partial [Naja naja]
FSGNASQTYDKAVT